MFRTSNIRFVGGPWHNRIERVELCQRVAIRKHGQPNVLAYYSLVEYLTSRKTHYWQYIHSSLIRGEQVACCTYTEQVPKWQISQRELQDKLRRLAGWKRSRIAPCDQ